jgi:hypothetical protein
MFFGIMPPLLFVAEIPATVAILKGVAALPE